MTCFIFSSKETPANLMLSLSNVLQFVLVWNLRIDHSRIMLLYSGIVFPSSFVNQRLIIRAPIKPAPLWLYLRLGFIRYSKRSSSADHSLLSLYALPPHCQFSGILTRQCFSSHIHFHYYHSLSHHSLLVSDNKPPSVIAELVGFYRHSLNLPTHSLPSFIYVG